MRVLFLSRRYPFPLDRGDNRRVFHFIEGVAREARVRVLCFGEGPALPLDGVEVRSVGSEMGVKRVLGRGAASTLRATVSDRRPWLPLQVRASMDSRFASALADELHTFAPDVVHASPSTMATHLETVNGAAHTHLDLMDAYSIVMGQQAEAAEAGWKRRLYASEARKLRRFEAWGVGLADSSSLASGSDKERAPGLEAAVVVPNGVSPREFPFQSPDDRSETLLFVGNYSWTPNVEAVTRVARGVLPLVREKHPDAELRIVGVAVRDEVAKLGELPGVRVVGEVPRVAPELHTSSCVLAPMWSGAGIKNKILEAMSAGTPVVTNQLGIEGIADARAGEHFLLAGDEQTMADACVRLIDSGDERARLAANAQRLVHDNYSWQRRTRALLDAYAGAGSATS